MRSRKAMAEYLSPGVYVEEVDSGMKPMEGVSTSTAGFIGMTQRGPLVGTPEFVGSYMEFQRKFGGYLPKSAYGERRYLPMAVEQFFANGGSRCFVVRILNSDDAAAAAVTAGNVSFAAANVGAWGNLLTISCKKNSMNDLLCTLVVDCLDDKGNVACEESYTDVSMAPESDSYLVKQLEKSLLVRASVQPRLDGTVGLYDLLLPQKAAAEVLGTAKDAADAAVTAAQAAAEKQPDAGAPVKAAAEAVQKAVGDLAAAADDLSAKQKTFADANDLAKESAKQAAVTADAAEQTLAEIQKTLNEAKDETLAEAKQALTQAVYAAEEAAKAMKKIAGGVTAASATEKLGGAAPEKNGDWAVLRLSGGADCKQGENSGDKIDAQVLKGTDGGPGKRTGLCAFQDVPEISIVAAPGVTEISETLSVVTHCESMGNRVCILDMPSGMNQVTELQKYRSQVDSSYAAMYHPWIQVFDPLERRPAYLPPSGAVAGIYARVDNTRGVHKAPANEVVRNCTGLETLFGKAEQDMLNPVGVNLIRSIQGQGIRVWGARTCSSDASWKYINVRRLFIFLEESIRRNTGWAVFEPNDPLLWTKVYNSITSFLGTQWRNGALTGASEAEAFFVNVGLGSSMTQDDVLNGRMICVIGVAPARPAEFIIFRISQIMEANG